MLFGEIGKRLERNGANEERLPKSGVRKRHVYSGFAVGDTKQ